ncbi:MAG TPA: prolyl oligopeptidase family serine peptidase [Trebonia sp.]|jgi:dipeptidyl-peptidase-4|nr:prolyl oligopeptidase family serine peptidase [Trebonia sp.]
MAIDDFPRQLAKTRRFTLGVPRSVTISRDGGRVLFIRSQGGEDPLTCLWALDLTEANADADAGNPRERLLADPAAAWHEDAGEIPEAERVRRERVREQASGIVAYSADTDCRTVVFALDGRLWTLRIGDDPRAPAPVPTQVPTAGPVMDPRIDPTGQRVAYVTDGALHVTELADGTDRLLAAPEHDDVTYGLAEHVAAESMHRYRGYWWAPDGRRLLAARVDNSPVQRWWIADPANPDRPPRAIRYPAAGTANADVSLFVLGLDGSRTEIKWDRAAYEYLPTVDWDAHGPLLSVQSRDQRTVLILTADAKTGVTSLLHTERDDAWVELAWGAPLRTDAGRLVTVSDTGGSRRLVVDGVPVTPDGLHISSVTGADGEAVYFTATHEQDPTQDHFWRYDPGREPTRISEEPGYHDGHAAGGAIVLLSRTEAGSTALAITSQGSRIPILTLQAEPLLPPRITWLTVGARDLRAALLLPSWYQPGMKLPVLLSPYAGPAMQLVVRERSPYFCEDQWFAEQGFAVLVADGRGTPGRGPAWSKTVFGDTLSAALEDQVDALAAVADQFPDLDRSRVGIRGWSFGGALAAMAVLRRPDVFHAAVSGAAPHDARLYDTHWREKFLGLPQDNPEAYDRSSTMAEAARLTKPLLLIHGMADDNVVVAHTLRMSTALLAAGRPHQVLPLSGSTHMPTDADTVSHLLHHQLTFLRESLGVTPSPQPTQGSAT